MLEMSVSQKMIPVNLSRINSPRPAFPVWSHFPALPTGSTERGHKDDQSAQARREIAALGRTDTGSVCLTTHESQKNPCDLLAAGWADPSCQQHTGLTLEPRSARTTRACLPHPANTAAPSRALLVAHSSEMPASPSKGVPQTYG